MRTVMIDLAFTHMAQTRGGCWKPPRRMIVEADGYPRSLLRTTPRTSSSVIDRPRLRDALLPLAPLTVVRAPAGAGKTVLWQPTGCRAGCARRMGDRR